MQTHPHPDQALPSRHTQAIWACMIGNALEWYDFVIYGYFASVISQLFFPSDNPFASLLLTFGVFAAGFIARPLGAVILGHIGDQISRKKALVWSLYIMAMPTLLIGCLPTYAQIGIAAPLLLTVFRLLQGFALGGEFTGSMVFMVEIAPPHRKSRFGSWATFSSLAGVLMGSVVAMLITHTMEPAMVQSIGWRIPFILSVLGSLAGAVLRRTLTETTSYRDHKAQRHQQAMPLRTLWEHHRRTMGVVVLIDAVTAIGFFVLVIFLPTFLQDPQFLGLPPHVAMQITTLSMVGFAASILVGGFLGDKMPKPVLLAGTATFFLVGAYPLFHVMTTPQAGYGLVIFAPVILSLNMGIFYGLIPAALSELFPPHVRFSGLSISHNMSMLIFGGTAPLLATHLIQSTGLLVAPAFLFMGAATLCLIGLLGYKPALAAHTATSERDPDESLAELTHC